MRRIQGRRREDEEGREGRSRGGSFSVYIWTRGKVMAGINLLK
jgi:hypothetical protein